MEKGVFGISVYNMNIQQCFTGYATGATLSLELDVDDTHKQYYQQLPLSDIGKQQDRDVLQRLDNKSMVIINVR